MRERMLNKSHFILFDHRLCRLLLLFFFLFFIFVATPLLKFIDFGRKSPNLSILSDEKCQDLYVQKCVAVYVVAGWVVSINNFWKIARAIFVGSYTGSAAVVVVVVPAPIPLLLPFIVRNALLLLFHQFATTARRRCKHKLKTHIQGPRSQASIFHIDNQRSKVLIQVQIDFRVSVNCEEFHAFLSFIHINTRWQWLDVWCTHCVNKRSHCLFAHANAHTSTQQQAHTHQTLSTKWNLGRNLNKFPEDDSKTSSP